MSDLRITKQILSALEKVFAVEIAGHLPFQSKARIYQRLADEGLVAPMERTFSDEFPGTVTVNGFQLTHAGRILYCSSCQK